MTSSSTGEVDDYEERRPSEDGTPTHTHPRQRRWSTPIHESLETKSNMAELISCSSENSYSFYLGEEISPWGPSGPPLLTESRSTAQKTDVERRGRSVTRKRDLPPFLTTLDCNGRPRFHHRRVRSEGRLEIASVAVDLPEIVSVRGREGLRIGTVRISQQHEEEEEEEEDGDDDDH